MTDIGWTFAGRPVACAAGPPAMEEYERQLADMEPPSRRLAAGLERLRRHDVGGDCRGPGPLYAVENVDPSDARPLFDPWVESGPNPVTTMLRRAREDGVLFGTGRPPFQIVVAPPFCIDLEDIDRAIEVLNRAIETTMAEWGRE